jgi:hypothetical protein
MAKLSSYRNLYKQDFPGPNQDLVDKLATTINPAFNELYDALNNKLTFTENFNATVGNFTITVDANGRPANATSFKLNDNQANLIGLFVINAFGAKDSSILPAGGVFVSFKKNNNYVIINTVLGLQPNISYNIKVVALG